MELYSEILEHGGPAFNVILRHIKDRPNDNCLFHCTGQHIRCNFSTYIHQYTAGKDRTGVLSAIVLSVRVTTYTNIQREVPKRLQLAGLDDETIAEDYELTQIGREPVRDLVLARLAKEPLFAEDKAAAFNMLTAK